ncbi:MAG TPA: S49 family peptidase [Alphaproteobacteria bacterium]|jgi:signal peptide peptidase SppA|nr:S49 family peptidase [Alphaproteobacteria bacterium]
MLTSWTYPVRRAIGATPPPVVPVLRLTGIIGTISPLRPGLTLAGLAALLERAFRLPGAKAVALAINSPGGSAAQSSLIHNRIRQLAAERSLPVLAFVEDVAASGGYWLACAADEIHADATSILGSIGVVSASFGFPELLNRIGVERRLHTTGPHKAMLDPFRPEQPGDVERLKEIQGDLFESFKALVRERRAGKLKAPESEIFTGAVWSGKRALEMGLIDGIGEMRQVLRARYGEKLRLVAIGGRRGWLSRRLRPEIAPGDWAEGALAALEERMLWSRYGL